MADQPDRPYTGSNFLVSIGEVDGRDPAAAFVEVVFPPFVLDRTRDQDAEPDPRGHLLLLRRPVTGSLDLYKWWNEGRRVRGRPQRKTVTVQLLGEDHVTVVLTWRFLHAHPVSLTYSPLRAMGDGVVVETVELAFDSVEMS